MKAARDTTAENSASLGRWTKWLKKIINLPLTRIDGQIVYLPNGEGGMQEFTLEPGMKLTLTIKDFDGTVKLERELFPRYLVHLIIFFA